MRERREYYLRCLGCNAKRKVLGENGLCEKCLEGGEVTKRVRESTEVLYEEVEKHLNDKCTVCGNYSSHAVHWNVGKASPIHRFEAPKNPGLRAGGKT